MDSGESTIERVGAYRVVRKLANAANSEVLLAKADGPLGSERSVILKLFASRENEELGRTFAREAASYCRLSHPTIVRLMDFFALPPSASRAGSLCMVLEHVEGPTLVRLRTLLKGASQELDDRASIHVAACIFEALALAHSIHPEAPLVHRDVNPSTVIIAWDGQVKVTDFGLAKVSDASHDAKGTYGYLAPEQAKGLEPTAAADVYAAGLILWELLTKRRAFQRGVLPEEEAIRAMAEPRLPAIETLRSDLPPKVLEVLRRALEPRVELRTITAEEAATVLSRSIVVDEGREQLVNALGAVRASADPSGAALPKVSLPPDRKPVTSMPPPATKRGVAPPPSSSSDVLAPISATDPFARTTPMDAFEIERRPPPPMPRRSHADIAAVIGKSATARLSIALPDPPAPKATLVMAPQGPAAPGVPEGGTADAGLATQPLTRTLVLPDRPPPPTPRSVPPLSLPAVAIAAPPAQMERAATPEPPALVPPVPARSHRWLPAVVTVAIVGVGVAVAYTRSRPTAVRPTENVDNVVVAAPAEPARAETAPRDSVPALAEPEKAPPTASATAATAPAVSASASVAPAPASPEIADEGALAADMGRVRTAGAVAGRRIFVDDKTLGQTPATVTVKCGRRTVKLGSAGKPQVLDVPCRGEVSFSGR